VQYRFSCCGSTYIGNRQRPTTCPHCQCDKPMIEEVDKEDRVILTQSFSGDKEYEERPWGNFKILLDTPYTKVKRITVNPNARLSLQYHEHRSEVWTIVNGYGKVQVGDVTKSVKTGGVVEIPTGYKHRVIASEVGITFVEVQLSNSKNFSEDDIVRIEDDYGRTKSEGGQDEHERCKR